MSEEKNPWQIRFERERKARKESESLLEEKSLELWKINQELEAQVNERTESLKEALIKAEKADRAKSDFLANISHEIRTPLNAIIGFSQYLSGDKSLNEKNSKYASIIESSATSLLSIINDILDFSKIESGNFDISKDDFNIYDICNQVVELFSQKTNEKHIDLIYSLDKDIPKYIITDGLRVRQVLSNLLSNAIKFTPEHGKVYFEIKLIQKSENKALIEFEVRDTGIGIPKDKIQSILNPFIQLEHIANKQNVGTGLGLSICNNILNLLDTKLQVESEVGKGSTFKFFLDSIISADFEEDDLIYIDEETKFLGKILLAEDNSANQELMKLVLSEIGIECKIASNGKEAVELYKEDSSFDMILMDINMPILNGVEAFYQIRIFEEENNLVETPIVALTANAIKGDKERFLSLGMNSYLSKPIQVDEFKSVASKYLDIDSNANLFTISNKEEKIENTKIDVSKIAEKLGIGENIANMIVQKFKNDIKKDMEEFKTFIEKESKDDITQKAHYIKNSCLNVALDDASQILQELESIELSMEEINTKFEKLQNIIENTE